MDLNRVIIRPIITEKATGQVSQGNQYSFQIAPQAGKFQIKEAIENFFGVKVKRVNVIAVRGKKHKALRTGKQTKSSDWKKAIVKLAEGEKIDIFEGEKK